MSTTKGAQDNEGYQDEGQGNNMEVFTVSQKHSNVITFLNSHGISQCT